MYEYQWYQWIIIFFCYCFFGWIFESTYVSLKQRRFVNRGFLRLPMLPLYGTGAVMMLFVSLPVKEHIIFVYVLGVVSATVLEYVTGWGMEKLFKMKYWDYSDKTFQINGYICLSSSIAWGFLTIALTKVIHKPVERLVLSMDPFWEIVFVVVFGTVFLADTIESTKAALDLGRALEAMSNMRMELEELQVQLTGLKSRLTEQTQQKLAMAQEETALHMDELRHAAAAKISEFKDSTVALIAESTARHAVEWKTELRAEVDEKLETIRESARALSEKIEKLQRHKKEMGEKISGFRRFYFRGILKGNRIAVPGKYGEALKELREELEK